MRKAGGGCRQGRAAFAGAMSEAGGRPTRTGARVPREISLSGLLAVGFGFAGIFSFGPVFVPLALLFSLAAFLRRRPAWGRGRLGADDHRAVQLAASLVDPWARLADRAVRLSGGGGRGRSGPIYNRPSAMALIKNESTKSRTTIPAAVAGARLRAVRAMNHM